VSPAMRLGVALVGGVLIALVGLSIALGDSGGEIRMLGWVFLVLGVLSVATNLALRNRMH
jgi:hypothetical protein